MKSVLVIGSEGFIGSNVVKFGILTGYNVHGIDIVDKKPMHYKYTKICSLHSEMSKLFSCSNFDLIINCAGSGDVSFSVEKPLIDFERNSHSVIFVLEAIRQFCPAARYIHLSSAAVYGNPSVLPVKESDRIVPLSPYGYHKWISEIICQEYATLYELSIAVVRPFSVYGPGLRKQLLWDVFQKGKVSDKLILWGTGDETRDFIFIEDLVNALFLLGNEKNGSFEFYNIANGVSVKINMVVSQLFHYLGWNKEVIYNGFIRKGDPNFWQADIVKLESKGFRPKFSLNEGLSETARWMKNGENE